MADQNSVRALLALLQGANKVEKMISGGALSRDSIKRLPTAQQGAANYRLDYPNRTQYAREMPGRKMSPKELAKYRPTTAEERLLSELRKTGRVQSIMPPALDPMTLLKREATDQKWNEWYPSVDPKISIKDANPEAGSTTLMGSIHISPKKLMEGVGTKINEARGMPLDASPMGPDFANGLPVRETIMHERGERHTLNSQAKRHPYASHTGILPHVLELSTASTRDPLYAHLSLMNRMDNPRSNANRQFVELYRNVGGTGSFPVQPGTRRYRALERLANKNITVNDYIESAIRHEDAIRSTSPGRGAVDPWLGPIRHDTGVPKHIQDLIERLRKGHEDTGKPFVRWNPETGEVIHQDEIPYTPVPRKKGPEIPPQGPDEGYWRYRPDQGRPPDVDEMVKKAPDAPKPTTPEEKAAELTDDLEMGFFGNKESTTKDLLNREASRRSARVSGLAAKAVNELRGAGDVGNAFAGALVSAPVVGLAGLGQLLRTGSLEKANKAMEITADTFSGWGAPGTEEGYRNIGSVMDPLVNYSDTKQTLSGAKALADSGHPILAGIVGTAAEVVDPPFLKALGRMRRGLDPTKMDIILGHGGRYHAPEPGKPLGQARSAHRLSGQGGGMKGQGFYAAEQFQVPATYRHYGDMSASREWKSPLAARDYIQRRLNRLSEYMNDEAITDAVAREYPHSAGALERLIRGGLSKESTLSYQVREATGLLRSQNRMLASKSGNTVIPPPSSRHFNNLYDPELLKEFTNINLGQRGRLYGMDFPDELVPKVMDFEAPLAKQPKILELLRSSKLFRLKDAPEGEIIQVKGPRNEWRTLHGEEVSRIQGDPMALDTETATGEDFYRALNREFANRMTEAEAHGYRPDVYNPPSLRGAQEPRTRKLIRKLNEGRLWTEGDLFKTASTHTSRVLNRIGIPAHTFLDQGSRGGPDRGKLTVNGKPLLVDRLRPSILRKIHSQIDGSSTVYTPDDLRDLLSTLDTYSRNSRSIEETIAIAKEQVSDSLHPLLDRLKPLLGFRSPEITKNWVIYHPDDKMETIWRSGRADLGVDEGRAPFKEPGEIESYQRLLDAAVRPEVKRLQAKIDRLKSRFDPDKFSINDLSTRAAIDKVEERIKELRSLTNPDSNQRMRKFLEVIRDKKRAKEAARKKR